MFQSIISVLGNDKAGIISKVTKVLYENDANLEDMSMTNLESELVMVMIVVFKTQAARRRVKAAMKKLEQRSGLTITFKDLKKALKPKAPDPGMHKYLMTFAGSDRTGIVYKVSDLFARHKFNISDLNSQIIKSGKNEEIYVLFLEVDVPPKSPIKRIEAEYKRLAKELDMDIQWRLVESLTM